MDALMDALYVVAMLVFFILTWALAVGCKKLEERK
ncbi:potassium ABC transporter ATPase [Glaciimonas sp. GG7]